MVPLLRQHPLRTHCSARLLLSGDEYFNKIEEVILSAKHYLHVQFYIYDPDATGNKITKLLKDAVRRGVEVMLVADAIGSEHLTSKWVKEIEEAGILFKHFSPKNKFFRIGRRMHHKIVVADGELALIGGINIADKYSGFHGQRAWLDFGVELKGPVVRDIEKICEPVWKKKVLRNYFHPLHTANQWVGNLKLRLIQNDWWRRRIEISKAYKDALRKANKEIIIVASYLLPGTSFRRLMKKAARRGVRIKIMLGGHSDVKLVKPATMYFYEWMMRQGMEIYEWQPSILHGKLAIVDDEWATVGSYNLNALSDYGSLELNVEIFDADFARSSRAKVEELITSGCKNVDFDEFMKSSTLILYVYRWFCYKAVRVLLRLLFMMMKRDRLKI